MHDWSLLLFRVRWKLTGQAKHSEVDWMEDNTRLFFMQVPLIWLLLCRRPMGTVREVFISPILIILITHYSLCSNNREWPSIFLSQNSTGEIVFSETCLGIRKYDQIRWKLDSMFPDGMLIFAANVSLLPAAVLSPVLLNNNKLKCKFLPACF